MSKKSTPPFPGACTVPDWVVLNSFRYALGRATYVTGDTQDLIRRQWARMGGQMQAVLVRDLEEAIRRDVFHLEREAEKNGGLRSTAWGPLGMECDRRGWYDLWRWLAEKTPSLFVGRQVEGYSSTQPIRVYVAGPGSDWRTCREVMQALRLASLDRGLEHPGFTITHDWTKDFEDLEAGGPMSPVDLIVSQDLEAVRSADFVVFVFPYHHKPAGAWVEWGVGHEAGKRLVAYLLGESEEVWEDRIRHRSLFLKVPGAKRVYTFEALLEALCL